MEHDHGSCDSHAVGGGDSCYRDRLAVPVLMAGMTILDILALALLTS